MNEKEQKRLLKKLIDDMVSKTPRSADEGCGVKEISEMMGWNIKKTRSMIKKLQDVGLCTTGKRPIIRIDGANGWSPVYKFTKGKE